jgi:hypothetical protein
MPFKTPNAQVPPKKKAKTAVNPLSTTHTIERALPKNPASVPSFTTASGKPWPTSAQFAKLLGRVDDLAARFEDFFDAVGQYMPEEDPPTVDGSWDEDGGDTEEYGDSDEEEDGEIPSPSE